MGWTLGPLWSRYLGVREKLRAGEGPPDDAAHLEDLRAQLIDALGQLEEQERLVATFYLYEGLTLKEIGKALGLAEGRISQFLRDALSKLREHLKRSSLAHEDWQALG